MLQLRMLEHLENARPEDGSVIGATRHNFKALLERALSLRMM
jgi:hypothetical protein